MPDAAQQEQNKKAVWVCEKLDATYGALTWQPHGAPLDTLVATMLSQHTSDKNSERAFDDLKRRFGDWDSVCDAPVGEVADAIRAGGLADSKAPRIQTVLRAIREKAGAPPHLDFLRDFSTDEAKAYLQSFHGVGPKTTACVLMFSLGRPVLPVDTHVFRVSHRLGLIPKGIGEAKAHGALESLLPPERVYGFHVHLIRHGRRVCVAARPRCSDCVLRERCDYFTENGIVGAAKTAAKAATVAPTTLHGLRPTRNDADEKTV